MNFDLSQLNEEQIKPVMDTEGAVLVTAGAGSGKTRLLTHRISHLIQDCKVAPYNILAITFTNKAAKEMKERLEKMIPDVSGLWVFTFHAMCARILRKFIDKIGFNSNFTIYAEQEKERLVKRILKDAENAKDAENVDEDIFKRIMKAISEMKNDGIDAEQFKDNHKFDSDIDLICNTYNQYEQELKKSNALDFDDLLNKTYCLLRDCLEVREYYQDKFHYIHVDEFQDTNVIQYQLIKLMSAKYKNIFVVGDEDQCIYGWRGANIKNIFDFSHDFNCKKYKLERNYRSTKKILELANKIIVNNTSRIEKTLWTENDDGVQVEVYVAPSDANEADYIVSCINSLIKNYNYKYSDFAILMRVNVLTRPFEERFIQYNMPHKVFGGFKFYERKEIKDLIAYLRILVNENDEEAITRIINFPKRNIGGSTVAQLRNYSLLKGQSLYKTIIEIGSNQDFNIVMIRKVEPFSKLLQLLKQYQDTCELSELVKYLIRLINLKELYAAETEENENRKLNIGDFVNSVKQYSDSNKDATLENYLQSVTLYSDLDSMDDGNNCINIATIHASKGLEFKVVFVVGLEDGVLPSARSIESPTELEEERRLMYVAITRARERLFLTRADTRYLYGGRRPTVPSRFLKEMGFEIARPEVERPVRTEPKVKPAFIESKIAKPKFIINEIKKNSNGISVDKFAIGTTVKHLKFGEGVILGLSESLGNVYAEIEFTTMGKINLSLTYAPLEIIE